MLVSLVVVVFEVVAAAAKRPNETLRGDARVSSGFPI
jgi:hypothetical protein